MLLPLTIIALFIEGCEDTKIKKNVSHDMVVINEIEKNITQKNTSLGCNNKEDKNSQNCTENNSAKFILSTLAKESENTMEKNTLTIKENLSKSLEEINKQEQNKKQLKEELIAFVEATNQHRGKDIENFINEINKEENEKQRISSLTDISSIKEGLNNLLELNGSNVKAKEVKKRLENLILDITVSKKNLSETKTILQEMVSDVEENGTQSSKKFVTALIEDVSDNKINIIQENKDFIIVKVQDGDNLSSLAQRYYNNTKNFRLIYEANKDKINSDYEIYPGSELLIPKI